MNRAEFLRAVADVVEAVDEHTFFDDAELRHVLEPDEDESLLDAAKRTCAAAQAAFDERKMYKDHATALGRLLGVNAGGDVVEAVRGLKNKAELLQLQLDAQVPELMRAVQENLDRAVAAERKIVAPPETAPESVLELQVSELLWVRKNETAAQCVERVATMLDTAGRMLSQKDNEGFLDAVGRVVGALSRVREHAPQLLDDDDVDHVSAALQDLIPGDGGDCALVTPEDWADIRKALCARGDEETTLAAAERNRDRIIELAREIDEFDKQIARAMRPIDVPPGGAVKAIGQLWAETHQLKAQLAEKVKELDEAKGRSL